MSNSHEVAENYDDYFSPDGNPDGLSPYSRRFGPYAVPAGEIIVATDIAIRAIANKYPGSVEKKDITEFSYVGLAAYLQAIGQRNPKIEAKELYSRIVDYVKSDYRISINLRGGEINILDFGCGDGRYLDMYEALAECFDKHGYNVNVCGYEISEKGLVQFSKHGLQRGYEFINHDWTKMRNHNLSVKLVNNPNPDATSYLIKERIRREAFSDFKYKRSLDVLSGRQGGEPDFFTRAPFDIAFCMFGVMACITPAKERIRIHRALFDLTEEAIFYTYPTQNFGDDPQIRITETNMEEGWVKYMAAGHEMKYALFGKGNLDYNKPGWVNSFEGEMKLAMAKNGVLKAGDYPLSLKRRPTHCSHKMVDYAGDFHDAISERESSSIYNFAIALPREQRQHDRAVDGIAANGKHVEWKPLQDFVSREAFVRENRIYTGR